MRKWRRWLNPGKAVSRKRQRLEERRRQRHGVDSGAEVMDEARKRKLARARTPAWDRSSFPDFDRDPVSCQVNRGCEPVGTAADYHGRSFHVSLRQFSKRLRERVACLAEVRQYRRS